MIRRFWKSKRDKTKTKELFEQAEKSQSELIKAAKDTLNLSKDLTGTLQAKLEDYASQIDSTSRLLSDALVLVNDEGIINSFNKSAETMYGWSRKEIIGKSLTSLFDMKVETTIDFNFMEKFCDEVNDENEVYLVAVKHEKFNGIKKDGSSFIVDVSASKFVTSNNKLNYLILIRDVTKRVENERIITKLSKQNNELAAAINASNIGVALIEANGYEFDFKFVNKGLEKMLQASRDYLLSTNLRSILGNEIGYWKIRKCLNTKESCNNEIKICNGESEIWYDIHLTPLYHNDNDKWILVFYNVNELKNAYEQLRQSHKKFSAFGETSSEALMIHNDGKILEWNQELQNITGYTAQELMNMSPESIAHPLERENMRRLFDQGNVCNADSLLMTKDGQILEISLNSKIIDWGDGRSIVTVIRDVTRFKDVDYQLKTSRERYRTVIDNTFDLICCFDTNFIITFTNQTFKDYFGCDNAIGFNILDIIPSEDRENFINYILSLSTDEPIKRGIHRVQNADGVRWTDWIDKAIFDENGNIVEYQSVCRDISHIIDNNLSID